MKKVLSILLFLLLSLNVFSQRNGSSVSGSSVYIYAYVFAYIEKDVYCYFNTSFQGQDFFGYLSKPDSREYFKEPIKFNNEIAVVNHLSNEGWELFQILDEPKANSGKYTYYFRKEQSKINKDELKRSLKAKLK